MDERLSHFQLMPLCALIQLRTQMSWIYTLPLSWALTRDCGQCMFSGQNTSVAKGWLNKNENSGMWKSDSKTAAYVFVITVRLIDFLRKFKIPLKWSNTSWFKTAKKQTDACRRERDGERESLKYAQEQWQILPRIRIILVTPLWDPNVAKFKIQPKFDE